jgi:hypothetical protein
MPRRRMGRPGLVGTMARTAAIAGTATAVSGGVSRRQQARAEASAPPPPAPADAAPAPAAPVAPAAPGSEELIDQLGKLADLKAQGLLDDAEFAAAKARLLG